MFRFCLFEDIVFRRITLLEATPLEPEGEDPPLAVFCFKVFEKLISQIKHSNFVTLWMIESFTKIADIGKRKNLETMLGVGAK